MKRLKEIELQYLNKQINKTELYDDVARFLSNRKGEEFEGANWEVVELVERLNLGKSALGKIFRKSREIYNR
ncbi:hypothetical protein [Paenibacillus medicaginis]|uniref:Uncharacterized protein n=1 Tax=Paenibacillus medicaginis TaxID=1470560 RepID=A0ABV5BUT3_9BACL